MGVLSLLLHETHVLGLVEELYGHIGNKTILANWSIQARAVANGVIATVLIRHKVLSVQVYLYAT